MKKVIIKQEPEKEVPTEVLAASIVAIAKSLKDLRSTRLNDKALHLLIHHAVPSSSRPSMREIQNVIYGISVLETTYLKQPPKAK